MSLPSFKFKDLPPLPPQNVDDSSDSARSRSVPVANSVPTNYKDARNQLPLAETQSSSSKRPPPLLNIVSGPPSLKLNDTNSSPLSSNSTYILTSKPSILIKQQSSQSMVSSLNINNAQTPYLEERTLNRRNLKRLVLNEPTDNNNILSIPGNNGASGQQLQLGNFSNNNSKISINNSDLDDEDTENTLKLSDPERKASTEELIENVQNLELGLEYQIPIKASELVTLKKLGSGNSGTVSKVLHLPTQKIMARKTIHLETKEVIQSQIIRELRIMHECDSEFIIGFYGAFLHEGDVVICMEYVDCRSLDKVFKLTGPFPEFILKYVAYSVISGLNYLYDNHRIIHRDVKPSNVLFDSKGHVKLCDFGVSRELINSMADTFVGTSTYMSPERIQGGVYTIKGDVWSLGLMLYELASGKFAFGGGGGQIGNKGDDNKIKDFKRGPDSILDLLQSIVNEKPPTLKPEDGFSPELCDFVKQCLLKEKERPDPHQLLKHPWLSDFIVNHNGSGNNHDGDVFDVCPKYRTEIKRWAKNVRRLQKGKPLK